MRNTFHDKKPDLFDIVLPAKLEIYQGIMFCWSSNQSNACFFDTVGVRCFQKFPGTLKVIRTS